MSVRSHVPVCLFSVVLAGCFGAPDASDEGLPVDGAGGAGLLPTGPDPGGSVPVNGATPQGDPAVPGVVSPTPGAPLPPGATPGSPPPGAPVPGTSEPVPGVVPLDPVPGNPSGGAGPGQTPVGNAGTMNGGGAENTPDPSVGGGTAGPTFQYPAAVAPWQPSQACVDRAAEVLAGLSLRQKAGQMVQGNSDGITPADVASYQFGSAFSGGNADPAADDSPQSWRSHVESFEAQAAGFGIPLIYGVDAVHGNNNVSDSVIFPHNIGLGATRNPALVREVGRITAREMRGTSIDWTFAPAISPARDERWGRIFESYSEDPALTAELAVAVVQGLQGDALNGSESVLACAKHFAGDGMTQGGVDQGDATVDDATFRTFGVDVYQPLINAGLGNIMVSYSSHNGVKMTENARWLNDVLKGEMGFRGFLGSDWAATAQLSGDQPTQVATAINAGLDMLMEPYAAREIVDMIAAAPTAGGSAAISLERIDDAVMRILTVKCEMGMLDPGYNPSADAPLLAEVGSDAHREVARQAVRESAVLLSNEGNALPLAETAKVHIAGSGADSVQRQCGGWTIDWQGLGIASVEDGPGVTSGTTIRAGIEAIVGAGNVTYSADGSGIPSDVQAVIVVLSEAPYAEGEGDVTDLDLAMRTPDVPVLQAAASLGVPVIAVLVSGRPLVIEPYLDLADAWLAAWLPGSEANALADVLFGRYAPTGQLGHSWPRTLAQVPINIGDADYASDPPLYPFGHGLGY
jgi:beta-glucosidase